MNVKKFLQVYFISTFVLMCIMLFVGYHWISGMNIGSGGEIAELTQEIKKNERKNVLLVGTDKSGVLADVIMIFSFSDEGNPLNVMSIQRDTEVYVGNYTWKINSVLQKGKEELVQTVKDITKIPIHDYAVVNFKAVEDVVNLLGGVDFYVPQDMDYEDPEQDLYIHLKKGQQWLNGANALKLLRFRGYGMADIERTKVQRDFIQAAFKQKMKVEYIPKVEGIFNAVKNNISSSITLSDVLSYVNMMKDAKMQTFEMPFVLTGNGTVVVDNAKMYTLTRQHFMLDEEQTD